LEQSGGERHLAAILHGDVAGYSRLMAGDEDATTSSTRSATRAGRCA
jgi:hypothetical protein